MEGASAERTANVAGVCGYLFRVRSEGRTRFCEAERLDPTVRAQVAPGADVLALATGEAEAFGSTEAHTRNYLKREGTTNPDAVLTAATVEVPVREGFALLREQWA